MITDGQDDLVTLTNEEFHTKISEEVGKALEASLTAYLAELQTTILGVVSVQFL
jgi:hypothetical protein